MLEFRAGDLDQAAAAHGRIAELDACRGADGYRARIGNADFLALIALDDGVPVGFKLGYAPDSSTFYSWLGGVDSAVRGHGIASRLLAMQEEIVAARGYTQLRVKSMNRYPSMLRLLIKNGYQIIGIEHPGSPDSAKILFSKPL